jgi:hypothetical protein
MVSMWQVLFSVLYIINIIIYLFIHMCIQCLGHFSSLPPPPPLLLPPPPSPLHHLNTRQKLFCPYL